MSKITMELIKELREKTQVGMMDCKKALIESDGNIEKAIEVLRKKGAAVAQKRSDKETNNGNVHSCVSDDFKTGVLIKIGCETDFSANTQDMKDFAHECCEHILEKTPDCISDGKNCLVNQTLIADESITIQDRLNELVAKISENIEIKDFERVAVETNGVINTYIHPGANLGVIVQLETDNPVDTHLEKLKQLSGDFINEFYNQYFLII